MQKKLTIAIASGKGGTGKTFVSTNLFNVLQKNNQEVTLVDCDAEEPNDRMFIEGELQKSSDVTQQIPVIDSSQCTYCGKCADYCSYNAIFFLKDAKMIKVMSELCHGCGACSVACQFGAVSEKDDVLGSVSEFQISNNSTLIEARTKVGVYSSVKVIKTAIQKTQKNELVLLDSPPGTSCPFIQTVSFADYVVLVTEPTPFGLSDLKQSVETLKELDKPYGVIINRAGLGNDEIYDYLQKENISLLMSIPFDKEIAKCYSNGNLLTNQQAEWENKFSQLFNTIKEEYANSGH